MSNIGQVNPAFEKEGNDEIEIADDLPKSPVKASHSKEPDEEDTEKNYQRKMIYKVEDSPPILLSVVLGLQHCLLTVGSTIGLPLALARFLCMKEDDIGYLGRAMVINTLFFISGIITFLQTTFGIRLPIFQGGSASYIASVLAILSMPHNQCPSETVDLEITNGSLLYNDTDGTLVDGTELWQRRMREIQGALLISSLIEMLLAVTGIAGYLMRFIGPLTIGPCVALIGLSLVNITGTYASGHWGVAALTFGLLILFSQYLRGVKFPCLNYSKTRGWRCQRTEFFSLFSVLITVILACIFCIILTVTEVFPSDPNVMGYRGRTDIKLRVMENAPWFRFPYPGQWGLPVVTAAGVVGTIAATIISMVESIGDYSACARLAHAPHPPTHAFNRGLAIEGFGSVIAALLGSSSSTSSYSSNVAAIGITRVASRRVMQAAGIVAFLIGMIGKFGAVAVIIPDPVIGGLFCVLFGTITAVGISNVQYVDLNSSRNLFVLGFSLFMGLTVPIWMKANKGVIKTGVVELDQIFTVLLETGLFIGFLLSIVLDNTLPGTLKERGMLAWRTNKKELSDEEKTKLEDRVATCYDLPFKTDCCRLSKYIPILPEFNRRRPTKKVEA